MRNRVRYKTFDQLSMADDIVYSQLPEHPFWSHIEKKIDFSFADQLCSVLYTGRGQHPYAPSLKLKIHLVQMYYDLADREVEEKVIGDLFIKRFLGLPVDFVGFDHSTLGLDRTRMGTDMFHACHLYILAQMSNLGLWGHKDERWIIDSFPTNIAATRVGSYRLIQRSMIQLLQHIKRAHPALYKETSEVISWETILYRLSSSSTTQDKMLAFSKLVSHAYGLLQWFEHEEATPLVADWPNKNGQQTFFKNVAILTQVLQENSRISEHPVDQPDSYGGGG
ncbi:transposase, partial [Pontibacillus yanchengensis]|uniref:transposase n=1 Tax=Pontibacillus yanchengensis TaxID=462910 RepID=UPI00055B3A58